MRRLCPSSRSSVIAIAAAISVLLPWKWTAETADNSKSKPTSAQAARGRYLLAVGNCNDCHTNNFAERDGNVPESTWLMGSPVGFKGPWGPLPDSCCPTSSRPSPTSSGPHRRSDVVGPAHAGSVISTSQPTNSVTIVIGTPTRR
jgi:hypothetical protein